MKKLFISVMLLSCMSLAYSQDDKVNLNLTAGDHLIKATKKANIGLILVGVGALITILPTVGGMDADQALPIAVMGGAAAMIGFTLNISAWQQFGKAGKKLNKF